MVRFVAMGDYGAQTRLRDDMAQVIWRLRGQIDAVFGLGDNFYEYGVSSVTDPLWKDWEESFRPHVPWYVVLGNHDYLGSVRAQVDYTHTQKYWKMPSPFYDSCFFFEGGKRDDGVHVFFLDTFTLAPRHSEAYSLAMGMTRRQWSSLKMNRREQLVWLDYELGRSRLTWRVVMGHYPVFSNGSHGDNDELIVCLLPILKRHRVDLYICGHDHNIAQTVHQETHFIVSGTGSKFSPPHQDTSYKRLEGDRGVFFGTFHPTHAEVGFMDHHGNVFSKSTLLPNRRLLPLSFRSSQK